MKRLLGFVGGLVVGLAAIASAQSTLGSLIGVVRDPSAAVLPGAGVTLTNDATGAVQEAATNQVGAFTFPQLPVGTYRATICTLPFAGPIELRRQ